MCTLECRPPSTPKLLLGWVSLRLFKFVIDHIYVLLKSMARGSDIEACGPYHLLNTKFVRSPSQAALSNVFLKACVHLKADLRPSQSIIILSLYEIVQKSKKQSLSPMEVHGSRQWYWGLRAISFIEYSVRSIAKSSSLIKCCPKRSMQANTYCTIRI